jgi:hypothetical protein
LDDLPDGRLKVVLSSCRQISQRKLSLEPLRVLYPSNKAEFVNIVEELSYGAFLSIQKKRIIFFLLVSTGDGSTAHFLWGSEQ